VMKESSICQNSSITSAKKKKFQGTTPLREKRECSGKETVIGEHLLLCAKKPSSKRKGGTDIKKKEKVTRLRFSEFAVRRTLAAKRGEKVNSICFKTTKIDAVMEENVTGGNHLLVRKG